MSGSQVRTLESGDSSAIMQLEHIVSSIDTEAVIRLRRRYARLRLLARAVAPVRKPAPLAMEWLQ